jgi:hypothetical protein
MTEALLNEIAAAQPILRDLLDSFKNLPDNVIESAGWPTRAFAARQLADTGAQGTHRYRGINFPRTPDRGGVWAIGVTRRSLCSPPTVGSWSANLISGSTAVHGRGRW